MADSILRATLWKVDMKCKNVMFFNIWTHFWKCIFLRLWHFSSPTTHAVKSIFWAIFQVYKTHVFGEAFFLLSQKHPPLFCQAAPLNLWTVHKPPPTFSGNSPSLTGVFPSTLTYHCFYVSNWVCKRPKAFSHAEDLKKSAGGLQSTASPPVGPGQSPSGG